MYCSHFGFHRAPFNTTPDPAFYFSTPDHEEAIATLEYAVFQRKGFVLITGEVGAGKTLLTRLFLQKVEKQAAVAVINHTHLTGRQLLAAVCNEFELDVPPDASNLLLAEHLQKFLLEQFARDRYAVVLLDEAQNLPDEAFEELRMLGNLEADDAKLLQVCILGQPELQHRFRQPSLRQIEQRLFRRFHLRSLDRQQVERYIRHRLTVAGCTRHDLFTPEAIDVIFNTSAGIPRVINRLCDNALLAAFGRGLDHVDADIIEEVLDAEEVPEKTAPEAPDAGGEVTGSRDVIAGSSASPVVYQTVTTGAAVEATGTPPDEVLPKAEPVDLPETVRRIVLDMDELAAPSRMAGHAVKAAKEAATQSRAALKITQAQTARLQQTNQAVRAITQRVEDTDKAVQALASRTQQRWQEAEKQLRDCQCQIQEAIEQAARRHEALQAQFKELSEGTVSPEQLEQVHHAHDSRIREMLAELSSQRETFCQALAEAHRQWDRTREQLEKWASEAVRRSDVEAFQDQFQSRIHEALQQVETCRDRIRELADGFTRHCEESGQALERLRRDQARDRAELDERIRTTAENVRDDLNARIGDLDQALRALDEQTRQTFDAFTATLTRLRDEHASAADVEALRQHQAQVVAELQVRLDKQNEQARELRRLLDERAELSDRRQAEHVAEIAGKIDACTRKLARLRRCLAGHVAAIDGRLVELAEVSARRAELEALQRQTREELDRIRHQQQAGDEDIRRQHEADRAKLLDEQRTATETLRQEQQALTERFREEHRTAIQSLRDEHAALAEAAATHEELERLEERQRCELEKLDAATRDQLELPGTSSSASAVSNRRTTRTFAGNMRRISGSCSTSNRR